MFILVICLKSKLTTWFLRNFFHLGLWISKFLGILKFGCNLIDILNFILWLQLTPLMMKGVCDIRWCCHLYSVIVMCFWFVFYRLLLMLCLVSLLCFYFFIVCWRIYWCFLFLCVLFISFCLFMVDSICTCIYVLVYLDFLSSIMFSIFLFFFNVFISYENFKNNKICKNKKTIIILNDSHHTRWYIMRKHLSYKDSIGDL